MDGDGDGGGDGDDDEDGPAGGAQDGRRRRRRRDETDEVIPSDDEDDEEEDAEAGDGLVGPDAAAAEGAARPVESADERRLRLAKDLLRKVGADVADAERRGAADSREAQEEEEDGGENGDAEGVDSVTRRLHEDLLKQNFRFGQPFAAGVMRALAAGEPVRMRRMRGDFRYPVTCLALAEDEDRVWVGGKDGRLACCDVETGAVSWVVGDGDLDEAVANRPMLSVAASSDGRYVATCGSQDGFVRVWDARQSGAQGPALRLVHTLRGHRAQATSLAFRLGTHVLSSGSRDRSVRLWNAAEGVFLENLFGHQSDVLALDALNQERVLSCAADKTVRLWKVPEQSHLLLTGAHHGPIDCAKMVTDQVFLSGSQDGTLALWSATRKRPISIVRDAHGAGHWISAVAAVRHSDLVASGSNDGFVRVWRLRGETGSLDSVPIAKLPCRGHVNALAVGHRRAKFVVVGHAREHRLGRWRVDNQAENGVRIFRLLDDEKQAGAGGDGDDEEEEDDDAGENGVGEDESGDGLDEGVDSGEDL